MPSIDVNQLSKRYPVAVKATGLKGTLRHFLRRQYQMVEAVRDISFRIEPGEIVGFLGPNGAGKTTTLKMLTGLIHPSSGTVRVGGQVPFQRRAEFLQDITLVMGQKQQLLWDLPALDSLRINAAIYGLSDKEFHYRIDELTEMLALQGKLNQPVRKLSLGERMKAEMMAALLHRPQVLFLDEPTLGLDVNAQVAVREFLQDYNRRYQATILLTSHYMADITALCRRVLLIYQGQLIYDGSLEGLLDRFAPYREVTVELSTSCDAAILSRYGELESLEGCTARLIVRREALTQAVSQLLGDLDVQDLTVSDPPVEEVIGRVFAAGEASGEVRKVGR
ncbi:ABC transporter ATP-binding protein [Nodosilinea nodulosa]|uniref:ABC transporter ATP-binding protein n=1 Tax=Nodosilinea nodulosa TaxID=416001 RepID=UPI0002FAA1F1|nr:ATP-binding cassette domain-containing protein [Nodosilinea nodulosa]